MAFGGAAAVADGVLGIVDDIGLRSTRIRTADDTLLIVPNSTLTTTEITNYGRRRYRRYQTRIGVAYATSAEGRRYWCATFGLPPVRLDHDEAIAGVLAGVNAAREEAKKPPLRLSPKLAKAALSRLHA